jgi:hypothetical protein
MKPWRQSAVKTKLNTNVEGSRVTTERQTRRFKSNATAVVTRQAKGSSLRRVLLQFSGEENLFDKMHLSLNMVLPPLV